jgi:putative ABC transport system permease protein
VVSPDYFRVMRIPIKTGRAISETDDERAPGAIIVNEALARRAWPDGQPVGQRVRMGGPDSVWRTVIGVVANVRHRGLEADPRPELYLPHAQWATSGTAIRDMYLVLRTTHDPHTLAADLPRTIRALDPNLPLASVLTMDDVLSGASAMRRLSFVVLATLAAAAAALAAVGLYGVIGFAVVQRTTEIGIRRALGASTGRVLGLVARQGGSPVLIGVFIGMTGAFALSRLMAAMLFQVSARDPLTFMAVPVVVGIVAAIAAYVPARRATRVDPMTAVRSE